MHYATLRGNTMAQVTRHDLLPDTHLLLKRGVDGQITGARATRCAEGAGPGAKRPWGNPTHHAPGIVSEVVRVCGKTVGVVSEPVVGVCRNRSIDQNGIPSIGHNGLRGTEGTAVPNCGFGLPLVSPPINMMAC